MTLISSDMHQSLKANIRFGDSTAKTVGIIFQETSNVEFGLPGIN